MDPNAALQEIRELLADVFATDPAANERWQDAALDLAQHVTNLDTWISGGGFLPTEWQNATLRLPLKIGD